MAHKMKWHVGIWCVSFLIVGIFISIGGDGPFGVTQAAGSSSNISVEWPPKLGKSYPDLEVIDHTGRTFRLSSLKGSVLVIEPIGMTCPACQAFSGAKQVGAFEGVTPQADLDSIEELFPIYTGGLRLLMALPSESR